MNKDSEHYPADQLENEFDCEGGADDRSSMRESVLDAKE